MVPYCTILIFAIIGAYNDGIMGLIIFGCIGFSSVMSLSWLLQKINGGAVPRKVRDETATDFVGIYSDLIRATYPSMSPFEAKELFSTMLDNIVMRALQIDPSLKCYPSPHIFFLAAAEIAEEQSSESEKKVSRQFVRFLRTHKFWRIKYK